VFTSTESAHVREVVTASREGGASLNVLAGLTAGNFSAFWMGIAIAALMGIGFAVSLQLPPGLMLAPAVREITAVGVERRWSPGPCRGNRTR